MTTQTLQTTAVDILREALVDRQAVEAAALYGSFARGDIEIHSDIDVLVLCSESRKLSLYHELKNELSGRFERLSLAVYTKNELEFLDRNRSLFLLHLSREANLLIDKTGYFRALLQNFRPKKSYEIDFNKSLGLVDPLKTVVRGSPNNFHRLSYIYSLFRVFGVYRLAERKIYEFSKSRMVVLLSEHFPKLNKHIGVLSGLRHLNSNFFLGGATKPALGRDQTLFETSVSALSEFCGLEFELDPLSYSEAVLQFAKESENCHQSLDYRLRTWFLLLAFDGFNQYCSLIGQDPMSDLSEGTLVRFTGVDHPQPIARTATETIDYLHRYPLKYFLNAESKIASKVAIELLDSISDVVS